MSNSNPQAGTDPYELTISWNSGPIADSDVRNLRVNGALVAQNQRRSKSSASTLVLAFDAPASPRNQCSVSVDILAGLTGATNVDLVIAVTIRGQRGHVAGPQNIVYGTPWNVREPAVLLQGGWV
jgi:hypothetical protein